MPNEPMMEGCYGEADLLDQHPATNLVDNFPLYNSSSNRAGSAIELQACRDQRPGLATCRRLELLEASHPSPGTEPPEGVQNSPQHSLASHDTGRDPEVEESSCSSMEEDLTDQSDSGSTISCVSSSHPGQSYVNFTSSIKDSIQTRSLRSRRNRRLVEERVRHKRQTLQDMARPLKQWLYKHRNNPYPTKSEKVALAQGSQMTLTQVSNWFANARRRLKNTVRDPDLSWAKRIKMYNSHVVGNAELLSVSSEDSIWESDEEREHGSTLNDLDNPMDGSVSLSPSQTPGYVSHHKSSGSTSTQNRTLNVHNDCDVDDWGEYAQSDDGNGDDDPTLPHKYKHGLLRRYLHDAYDHSFDMQEESKYRKRNPSGSLSSHDYEEMSTSSRSSPVHEHSMLEELPESLEMLAKQWGHAASRPADDMYWKEISAALALTTLARSRSRRTEAAS